MPNLTPEEWDERATTARAQRKEHPMPVPGFPCATMSCVDITDNGDGTFTYTSTIEGNTGAVTYLASEVAAHFAAVKDGKWDAIEASAVKHAAKDLATA